MSIVIMKALMVFHDEWKVIIFNSAGCPTINTYKLLMVAFLNVTETLWWLLELRREKDKVVKVCKDIQERNHAMKDVIQIHTNREQVNINSVPWMFTEQQSNVVKEVMQKIKFPTGFYTNLKNIITKKVILRGSKHMIGTSSSR